MFFNPIHFFFKSIDPVQLYTKKCGQNVSGQWWNFPIPERQYEYNPLYLEVVVYARRRFEFVTIMPSVWVGTVLVEETILCYISRYLRPYLLEFILLALNNYRF